MDEFYLYETRKFVTSKKEGKIVILGIPLDLTQTFRFGTKDACDCIRYYSESIEDYSPKLNRDLSEINYIDIGNLILPQSLRALEIIEKFVEKLIQKYDRFVFLGGEHLITYPIVKALKKRFKNLSVIQFDAHLDLRDEYLGEKFNHATVMRRIFESGIKIYQFGVRSGSKEEYSFAKKHSTIIDDPKKLKLDEVYITIDMDFFDPAYCPGVTNPEPCGFSPKDFFELIYELDFNLIGFDIVEVAPQYDSSGITCITAAKIVREMMLKFFYEI